MVNTSGDVAIYPANFGSTTYLGEALFTYGDYAEWNWVWNASNQTNEGFDISFTVSTTNTSGAQPILYGGSDGPRIYIMSSGALQVYFAPSWHTVANGLNDGAKRVVRVVWSQDNGGSSTLTAYLDGVAQTPVTLTSPMLATNTANAYVGRDSGSSNYFVGTLSDISVRLNGGTTYSFPFARDANSTDGTYTGTFASLDSKPLFRTYDSTNLKLGGTRQTPSTVNSGGVIDKEYQTKGY